MKGWKEDIFNNFLKLNRGFDLPNHLIIDGIYPVVASTSIKAFHRHYKIQPPCVVTGRSGSLGKVLYINRKSWPLNTTLYVKDFKGNNHRYVYYFLQTMHLENYNTGAGVPTLNRNHLNQIQIKSPPKQLQHKFHKIIDSILSLKDKKEQHTQTLKQTRDRLLTRLISGKLSVADLDIRFPRSMREESDAELHP